MSEMRVNTQLSFTPEAVSLIGDMQTRVYEIGQLWGKSSDEYLKALESLTRSLAQVIRLGGRVTVDGDLSLYGVSFIHFGMIWHSNRNDPLLGEWSVHT